MRKARNSLFWVLIALVYIVCAFLVITPPLSGAIQEMRAGSEAKTFEERTAESRQQYQKYLTAITTFRIASEPEAPIPKEIESLLPYPELYAEMQEYNKAIQNNQQKEIGDIYDFSATLIDPKDFGFEDGVIGTLYLPGMDKTFPLYLGASMEHLAHGVAQMAYTSMPIGGEGTNIVIAGHRGWSNGKFLKDIEDVQIGSVLVLTTPWEEMWYRATEIKVIDPHDVSGTLIQKGKDLLTVLTCHPYGTGGKYRYLLICEREKAPEEAERPEEAATRPDVIIAPIEYTIPEPLQETSPHKNQVTVETNDTEFVSSKPDIFMENVFHGAGIALLVIIPIIVFIKFRPKKQQEKSRKRKAENRE